MGLLGGTRTCLACPRDPVTVPGSGRRGGGWSRRGLLAAIALLYKRKAEILMMFDYGPDMDRQIRAIDAEIARRVEQLSEADRGHMIADGSADPTEHTRYPV